MTCWCFDCSRFEKMFVAFSSRYGIPLFISRESTMHSAEWFRFSGIRETLLLPAPEPTAIIKHTDTHNFGLVIVSAHFNDINCRCIVFVRSSAHNSICDDVFAVWSVRTATAAEIPSICLYRAFGLFVCSSSSMRYGRVIARQFLSST